MEFTDKLGGFQDLQIENNTQLWNETRIKAEFWLGGNETFFENFTTHLNMRHLVLLVMCLFILTLVLIIVLVLRLRRAYLRWQRRKAQPPISIINGHSSPKRGILGRMIARIEEFDSLTPLIVTPSSISEDPAQDEILSRLNRSSLGSAASFSSPPPPRRGPAGKVTLVPLTTNLFSRSRPPTLNSNSLLIHDLTGMEMTFSTTTRSVGTIPEVEVYENETPSNNSQPNGSVGTMPQSASGGSLTVKKGGAFSDLDLISIDRTSVSTLDKVVPYRERPRPSLVAVNNNNNGSRANSIPPPNYRPPAVPTQATNGFGNGTPEGISSSSSNDSLKVKQKPNQHKQQQSINNGGNLNNLVAISPSYTTAVYKQCLRFDPVRAASNGSKFPKESPSIDSLSSNLSSPLESSVGESGSPLDTTGSIADLSDSFYLASESDTATSDGRGYGKNYCVDSGAITTRSAAAYSNAALSNSDKSESDLSSSAVEAENRTGKRYQLDRIEEESEAEDNFFGTLPKSRTVDSLGSALSQEPGSVLDSESNLLMTKNVNIKQKRVNGHREGLI